MNRLLIILIFSNCLFVSCKKEDIDFRNKFLGNYTFTVAIYNWYTDFSKNPIVQNGNTSIVTYVGTIKQYSDNDDFRDLCKTDTIKNFEKRITIEFLENIVITPIVNENGVFIESSGYHYHHRGGFVKEGELQFIVDQIGGLGSGTNYYISGIKKRTN